MRAAIFGGRAVFVALENAVVIGKGAEANIASNFQNALFACGEHFFALADPHEVEVIDKA